MWLNCLKRKNWIFKLMFYLIWKMNFILCVLLFTCDYSKDKIRHLYQKLSKEKTFSISILGGIKDDRSCLNDLLELWFQEVIFERILIAFCRTFCHITRGRYNFFNASFLWKLEKLGENNFWIFVASNKLSHIHFFRIFFYTICSF